MSHFERGHVGRTRIKEIKAVIMKKGVTQAARNPNQAMFNENAGRNGIRPADKVESQRNIKIPGAIPFLTTIKTMHQMKVAEIQMLVINSAK